jgi:hypothetical protein
MIVVHDPPTGGGGANAFSKEFLRQRRSRLMTKITTRRGAR